MEASQEFKAESALILYQAGGRSFITHHPIENGNLLAGVALTRETLIKLCAVVMPEIKRTASFLPENVVAYTPGHDHGIMLWWTPAQVRAVHFARSTKMPSGRAPLPPMVFMASPGHLHAFALAENKRPSPETQLYYSPFFNNPAGGVCLGNMKAPADVRPESIPDWERMFFDSNFTLEGAPALAKGFKGELLWRKLIAKKLKNFPVKALAPVARHDRRTIKELLHG